MRLLLLVGAGFALVASIFVLRIVIHSYTDHGHLDIFHLVVSIVVLGIGGFMAMRAIPRRTA